MAQWRGALPCRRCCVNVYDSGIGLWPFLHRLRRYGAFPWGRLSCRYCLSHGAREHLSSFGLGALGCGIAIPSTQHQWVLKNPEVSSLGAYLEFSENVALFPQLQMINSPLFSKLHSVPGVWWWTYYMHAYWGGICSWKTAFPYSGCSLELCSHSGEVVKGWGTAGLMSDPQRQSWGRRVFGFRQTWAVSWPRCSLAVRQPCWTSAARLFVLIYFSLFFTTPRGSLSLSRSFIFHCFSLLALPLKYLSLSSS